MLLAFFEEGEDFEKSKHAELIVLMVQKGALLL